MNDANEIRGFPDEAAIHAYVDGRLDSIEGARVEAWLDQHPERAAEIRGWRRDAQQLRAELGGLPGTSDRPDLDPARIRLRRRQRARARLALAASLAVALGIGGLGGWQVHQLAATRASAPMADAVQAYRMFAMNRDTPFDVTHRHPGQLRAWLSRYFQHVAALPDLAASGFMPVGGRLIPTDSGPAAMVLYENQDGDVISFYIRSPSPQSGLLPRGQRQDGQLAAAYWSANGYNYALVSRADSQDLRVVREALRPMRNGRG